MDSHVVVVGPAFLRPFFGGLALALAFAFSTGGRCSGGRGIEDADGGALTDEVAERYGENAGGDDDGAGGG